MTITAMVVAAAGCAADNTIDDDSASCDDGKCDGFEGSSQRMWSFAYVYPQAETADDVARLLSLTDLGLDRTFFDAALGHMTGAFALPGADADDAPRSPMDPAIIHEGCLRDPSSWRVTQVRFAPYQVAVPGTVSALRTWAKRTQSRLDQMIEVRLSVHPFCANDSQPDAIDREDQAMHLIYRVQPDDAALAAVVFANADEFATDQLAGTAEARQASYAALDRHRAALASADYRAFHKAVVAEWQELAKLSRATAADFAAHDANVRSLRATGVAPFQDRFTNPEPTEIADLSHPALRDREGALRPALAAITKKYARPDRLHHVALMFTVGSQDPLDDFQETRWFFSVLRPGRFAQLATMPAGAESVYGAFTPARLETFVAVAHDRGVDLIRATDAGFYSESRGAFTGPRNVYPTSVDVAGRKITVKTEADRVDYKTALVLDEEQGHDMPTLPAGKTLLSAMRRFADIDTTNASTTPCDRCHNTQNFVRDGTANGYRPAAREESSYQFHMITPTNISLRTVNELDRESIEAARELNGQ